MSSLIDVGKNPTNVNVSSLDNTTVLAKKIQHMKTISRTQALTKYNKPNSSIPTHLQDDYYRVLLSWAVIGLIGFQTFMYQAKHQVRVSDA